MVLQANRVGSWGWPCDFVDIWLLGYNKQCRVCIGMAIFLLHNCYPDETLSKSDAMVRIGCRVGGAHNSATNLTLHINVNFLFKGYKCVTPLWALWTPHILLIVALACKARRLSFQNLELLLICQSCNSPKWKFSFSIDDRIGPPRCVNF